MYLFGIFYIMAHRNQPQAIMLSPRRIIQAFSYTRKGLTSAWHTEASFRDDVVLVLLAQLFCLWWQPPLYLWLLFVFANALLLVTELLNTGLEYLADAISTELHPLLGNAKDVGSAAVFVLLLMNVLMLTMVIVHR